MANRLLNQFPLTFEKRVVTAFAHVVFGSSGTPTLTAALSKGIVSITHDTTGKYTFVFGTKVGMLDVYNKLLHAKYLPDCSAPALSASAPTAPHICVGANSVAVVGTCSLQLRFYGFNGSLADPAQYEVGRFEFRFKDSTAP